MTYVPVLGRVVRAGGWNSDRAHELFGKNWVETIAMPTDRNEHRAVSDPVRARMLVFGGVSNTGNPIAQLIAYKYRAPFADEICRVGRDLDGDGLVGCADPDCAGACAPTCPPLSPCPIDAPRCGDGTCGPTESPRLCPADCGAPVPLCGDGWCDSPEMMMTCPADCS
jgi:hypothetical protein